MKALVLTVLVVVCLHGEDFRKTKLMRQNAKGKAEQVAVALHIDRQSISIQGKKVEPMVFEFERIKSIEYERSTHPRWRTAIFVSPLFLLSKAKHHWLNIRSDDGRFAILRLGKKEHQMIRSVMEANWGKEITIATPE